MTRYIPFAIRILIVGLLASAMSLVLIHRTPAAAGGAPIPDPEPGGYVREWVDGKVRCRPANIAETRFLAQHDPDLLLREIPRRGLSLQAAGTITIVLRGTNQLDGVPEAKQAFQIAAEMLEAIIQASQPVSIVFDVDFGDNFFGQPYPGSQIVGLTRGQSLGFGYRDFREALTGSAETADELALFQKLPSTTVPTDIGAVSTVFVQSPAGRTVGLLPRIADPDGEMAQFGPPPAIGLNSRFAFDFNRADGIAPGRVDGVAVILHEFLHAAGFGSLVGRRELDPTASLAVFPLDLFRFRPGAALEADLEPASFTDAQRILSSGGDHVFFAGGEEAPLSTGRPDASGGDGFQASHWKDNSLAGRTIGIMDPQISAGELGVITESDLRALDVIGYGVGVGAGDQGGPDLKSAAYNGTAMIVKATNISGQLQLVVNDVVVAPPKKIKVKGGGAKLKIPGTPAELNLRNGPNLVRLIRDGLRSNVFVMNF